MMQLLVQAAIPAVALFAVFLCATGFESLTGKELHGWIMITLFIVVVVLMIFAYAELGIDPWPSSTATEVYDCGPGPYAVHC